MDPIFHLEYGEKNNHWLEKHKDNLIFPTESDIFVRKVPWFLLHIQELYGKSMSPFGTTLRNPILIKIDFQASFQ